MALSNNPNQAEVVKTIKDLESNKQNNLPTTSTAGKVLKSTSTAGVVEWGDTSGGTTTDVQINGTSITSSNVANIITNSAYNASSNKIATMSDLPTDTNTWRPVKVNGTEKLTNSTSGNSLDLVAGTNVSLSESNGAVTISATDTDTGATSVGLKTGDTGNVVTNMTYDSGTRKITFEKGITALTSHQDISGKANTDASNLTSSNKTSWQTALNNLTTPSLTDSTAHTQTGQATVVESYLSSDKKTWYRIWSDGWKECGGTYSRTASDNPGPYDNITATINLPTGFAFSNINYQVQLTNQWGGSGGSYHVWSVSEHSSSHMSTTSFDAICMRVYLSGKAATIACYYYCCGY